MCLHFFLVESTDPDFGTILGNALRTKSQFSYAELHLLLTKPTIFPVETIFWDRVTGGFEIVSGQCVKAVELLVYWGAVITEGLVAGL